MSTYIEKRKYFIESCLETFDELASSPEELIEQSERFIRIRECFLNGTKMLDSESELEKIVRDWGATAREISEGLIRETIRSLALLSEFCMIKAKAIRRRLAGNIDIAMRYENQAEKIYEQLPDRWSW